MFDALSVALGPKTTADLGVYYLIWMAAYIVVNFIWDWRSAHTPPFHIANIGEKLSVLYNASTFASGLLLILSVRSQEVAKIAGDSGAPIALAGLSALLVGIAGICPYKPGSVPRNSP